MTQSCTILYVEDDPATRSLVEHSLATLPGYRVVTAENGVKGLEAFRNQQFDIVLTDIFMPKMNGLEMARAIRELAPECQIIVMTAFSDNRYLMDAIDIGINQFVLKPIEREKLLKTLDRCCSTIQIRRQLQAQEAELRQSKKMESIGILAGGMAHDFNNLLQVILGYVSLALQNVEPGSKVYEMLAIAERSSGEARKLSQRLLSLARGSMSIMHVTPIVPLVHDCVLKIPDAPDITVNFTATSESLPVLLDAELIHQLVTNVLTNAREALPESGGTITINVELFPVTAGSNLSLPEGNYARITITDTGCGIPADLLADVFDPYVTTKEMGSIKGVGLGLTICHAIIRKHKGVIMIESPSTGGTAVQLLLPLAETTA